MAAVEKRHASYKKININEMGAVRMSANQHSELPHGGSEEFSFPHESALDSPAWNVALELVVASLSGCDSFQAEEYRQPYRHFALD